MTLSLERLALLVLQGGKGGRYGRRKGTDMFLRYADGEPRVWWHHSRERRSYRAWVHYGRHGCAHLELSWLPKMCSVSISFDDEHGWGMSLYLIMVGLHLSASLPQRFSLKDDRTIMSLSIHDGAVWWAFYRDPMSWDSSVPKWRDGSFSVVDFLLGKSKYEVRTLEERQVLIPMPEGSYKAQAKLFEATWRRSRWFSKCIIRVSIDLDDETGGIPHAGKGTTSYNCGDDATFGITTGPCNSIPEGVGILVGSCLKDRVRYGGWDDWTWNRLEAAE